jgi:hypothetical protein
MMKKEIIMIPSDLYKFLFTYCHKCAQRNEMYNDRYGRIFYCSECCEYVKYDSVEPSTIRFDTRKFAAFLKGTPHEMKDILLSLYMNMDKIDDVAIGHESIQYIQDLSKQLK